MMRHILALSLLFAIYNANAHEKNTPISEQHTDIAQERLAIPNFPVTDRWGQRAGFRETVGTQRSLILGFSYTSCESLCNITNAILSEVDKALVKVDESTKPLIVSVGIDAVKDTPEALQLEATQFGASNDWIWLTGGVKGTRPLLDTLHFPASALADHDPIFLVGRPCRGKFSRVVGIPDPAFLIKLAAAQPPCEH